jgi:hypothetical protein
VLGFHDVRGLRTLRALYDVKFHILTFLERFEPIALESGIMDEHVLSGFQSNETKALTIVEPFDGALRFHSALLFVTSA